MNEKTISGYHIVGKKGLTGWERIFEEWAKILDSYSEDFEELEDAAYWYLERTNVGVLAAAAIRADFHALEEFREVKTKPTGKIGPGRADLYISHRKGAGVDWYLEAKQRDGIGIGALKLAVRSESRQSMPRKSRLYTVLKLAFEDCSKLTCDESLYLGIFPIWRKLDDGTLDASELTEELKLIDRELPKFLPVCNQCTSKELSCLRAVAWCFPAASRSLKSKSKKGLEHVNPGVVLFLGEYRRG